MLRLATLQIHLFKKQFTAEHQPCIHTMPDLLRNICGQSIRDNYPWVPGAIGQGCVPRCPA
jgi:hypothetical protein